MKKAIETMIESIKAQIVRDLKAYPYKNEDILDMVLAVYNDFQESERDGVDYIFDIDNADDLKCCVEGGLTAKEICGLWHNSQMNTTKYFYFGCNYEKPKAIANYGQLIINLISWLDEVIPNVLAYPYAYESYKDLYRCYVTDVIIDYPNDLHLSDLDALAALKRKMEAMG